MAVENIIYQLESIALAEIIYIQHNNYQAIDNLENSR